MAKIYQVSSKIGTYKDSTGMEKGQYSNLGDVYEGRDPGQLFIVLSVAEMLFLAHKAIANGDHTVRASFFEPKASTVAATQKPQIGHSVDDRYPPY